MKRYFLISIVFLLGFVFSGANCEKDETCEDTEKEAINRSFNFTINVYYSDSVPYNDRIEYEIYKTYCKGNDAGRYEAVGYCDDNGFYNPAYTMTYKFANELDRVTVYFRVETSGQVGLEWHSYKYNDVAQKYFGVEEHFTLMLPLTSEADTLK